jgi:hypothetical protein
VNKFPAAFHIDADEFMETWSVRQRSPTTSKPVPTLLPQLGLALSVDANATVWTSNLNRLMHAALDIGVSSGHCAARGANDAFHLQARGASTIPVPANLTYGTLDVHN